MPWDMWTRNLWAWPLASMEMWRHALNIDEEPPPVKRAPPQWLRPARLMLELAALRIWDFSTQQAGAPTVVVTPLALHDAQLVDLAPGHSLMEALLRHGGARLYLVEWKSATPATKHNGIDDQLAALNVAIDDIGAPVDLIGLCQGGWLSLVYAARFPEKTRRLVIVGAPVDLAAEPSILSEPIDSTSDAEIRHLIDSGGGCVKGERMATIWPREKDEEKRLIDSLQVEQPFSAAATREAIAAFRRWDQRTLDLPGPYFCEVIRYLFRENRLARGVFPALGRNIDLRALRQPLFLLAGENDTVAPPAQALAAARLVGGEVKTALAPCGHLALYLGRRTLESEWPRIAKWLVNGEAQS